MGDRERVRRLLEEGADVNARDSCGNTPLHLAVHFGGMLDRDLGFEWITVLKWLVERGADLNARDAEGRTPLHVAAMLGYNDAINVLLPRADPNARDKYGKTPLHYMAERRNVSGIRLLKGGARELDPNIKDNEGRHRSTTPPSTTTSRLQPSSSRTELARTRETASALRCSITRFSTRT